MWFTRALPYLLAALLLLVQGGLWLGKGSIPEVMTAKRELALLDSENAAAREHNKRLQAELEDFREGVEMVEERARSQMSMIRSGEVLVQITPAVAPAPSASR